MTATLARIPDLDTLDPAGGRHCLWSTVDMFPEGDTAEAKAVCADCPVRQKCETAARAIPRLGGVWGGTDENDRSPGRWPGRSRGARTGTAGWTQYPHPCLDCGRTMYTRRKGRSIAGVRIHSGKGLCDACYLRARRRAQGAKPRLSSGENRAGAPVPYPHPCRQCSRSMVRQSRLRNTEGFLLHLARGLCQTCYQRDRRAARRNEAR